LGREYSPSAFTSMMSTLISGIDGTVAAEDMTSTLSLQFIIIIIRALALHRSCGHQHRHHHANYAMQRSSVKVH
jgi:hypothetical protein